MTANVIWLSCAGKVPSWKNSCLQRFFYTLTVVGFVNGTGDLNNAHSTTASTGGGYGKATQKQTKHTDNCMRYSLCNALCCIRALEEQNFSVKHFEGR